MFRKIDGEVQNIGNIQKIQRGVNIDRETSVIVVGSDNDDINGFFFVQPIKYNNRAVYKSEMSGSYLYFVAYSENSFRWQIGQPNGGIKNEQPLAFVNSNARYAYDIPDYEIWLVFDVIGNEWIQQSQIRTYNSECTIMVAGAWNERINGIYHHARPFSFDEHPIFEKIDSRGNRYLIYFEEQESTFGQWCISEENVKMGDFEHLHALVHSQALCVDGVSGFEVWREFDVDDDELDENFQLRVTGDCSNFKNDDRRKAEIQS